MTLYKERTIRNLSDLEGSIQIDVRGTVTYIIIAEVHRALMHGISPLKMICGRNTREGKRVELQFVAPHNASGVPVRARSLTQQAT